MAAIILTILALIGFVESTQREWTVEGATRTAIVHTPATKPSGGAPVVFVFHGHGGNARNVERAFALHDLWPEAVVVYPQGLAAKTKLDPQGKRPGWQMGSGDGDDRDLKFYDAMLATLRADGWVDPRRVYVTGHSNGGAFTYFLSGVRNGELAAVAPSAAGTGQLAQLKPIPLLHLGGRKDAIVPFEGQERMMQFVRRMNQCAAEGTTWAPGCLHYASAVDAPFVSYIHDGGHEFTRASPALIVKFFKEHARPARADDPTPNDGAPAKVGAPPVKPPEKPDDKPTEKPAAKPPVAPEAREPVGAKPAQGPATGTPKS